MKDQFPPQGTKCVDCGCCQATVYAGNDPLCWECDEQKPCRGTKRPVIDASAPEMPDLRSQFDRDEPGTSDEVEKQEEETTMPKKAGGGLGRRIDDATRAAIQAEPDDQTYEAIGRKFNISGVTARAIKLEARKKPAKVTSIKNAPIERVTDSDSKPGCAKISVHVEIDEIWADRYWAKLDLEQKAAMIQMQLLAIVERAQA